MKRLLLLASAIWLACITAVAAPNINCVGQVVDEAGEPLAGAAIRAVGTQIVAIADVDGKFKINVPASCKELNVSFVGYKTVEMAPAANLNVITMVPDSKLLNDVVVTQSIGKTRETPVAMSTIDAEQLEFKQKKVEKLLKRFCTVEKIIGMKTPYHYRNKVQAAFYTDKKGKIISGVYQSGSHHVVGIDSCQTEDVIADKIIVAVRKLLPSFRMTTYNEDTGKGFLRHILVKRGFATNQIMLVLVTGTPVFPSKNNFVKAILKQFPEITTIVQNINPYRTNLVLGDNQKVLYGKGYIEDILCGCRFRISPKSFYQINPVQAEVLYGKAIEFANLKGNETVLDTYCGIGTIGIIAAKNGAGNVIGAELNGDAVRDAIVNARANNLKNIRFYKADAGEFMREAADEDEKPDVVFMDPPRAGSDRKFLDSLIKMSPKKVVYVSCNPETLARDLAYLTQNSPYKAQKIQPVDMFPHTAHIETVVLMSRK